MDCTLIGTGGMMPLPDRLLTSLAVRLDGRICLFDAGEGAQLGLKKTRLGLRGLDLIAVTHLHADHCLGIPGIMMLRSQMDDPDPLTIVGPPGIERFITQTRETLEFFINYPVTFVEWTEDHDETAYEDERMRLIWQPLDHSRFCLGYRLEEAQRPGKFDPGRARSRGIAQGPLWGALQKGETVTLEDGTEVAPGDVLGKSRRGRIAAFVVDTRPCKGIYRLCKDADIAFIEGMFLPEHAAHAEAKGHMSVDDAARIAGRAGVRQAVLVHISPRYRPDDLPQLNEIARSRFEGAKMGEEFQTYPVSYS